MIATALSKWKVRKPAPGSAPKLKRSPNLESMEDRLLMTSTQGCYTPPPPSSCPCPCPSTGVLAGTVFNDLNKNGTLDGSDAYIQGVKVTLYRAGSSEPYATTKTDSHGQYAFTGLAPGDYTVVQSASKGYTNEGTDIHSAVNPAYQIDAKTIHATVADPTKVYDNNGGNVAGQYTVVGVTVNGVSQYNSAGTLAASLGTTAGATNLNHGFSTFCVDDMTSQSFYGGESFQVRPRLVTDLSNAQGTISADHAGRIAYLFNHYAGTALSSTQGAGLQLAIWELLYDTGSKADFTSGNFQVGGPNAWTDQATLDQALKAATAFYSESAGKSETAILLDTSCDNHGGEGYQSVLAQCELNFADTCSPTGHHGGDCGDGGDNHGGDDGHHGGDCGDGGHHGGDCGDGGDNHDDEGGSYCDSGTSHDGGKHGDDGNKAGKRGDGSKGGNKGC